MENFIVIDASNISDLNESVFVIEKNKELDIKKMLEDNQEFFIDYMSTGYIEQPLCNDMDDISDSRDVRNKYYNFIKNFVASINRVEVVINVDDDKYVSTNNKSILYIAKKYDLKILVCLV